ncbi:MAG: 2Fe-2S iron-sulfur cluster-binding protein [Candidatus Bathyarchaeia archaeon]
MMGLKLKIDDKEVEAMEGETILDAAKKLGIEIPTLCHHEGLEPYGACRICSVEIEKNGRKRIVAACCYPAEEGLNVKTRSPRIDRIRRIIIELAAINVGGDLSGKFLELAAEYKADTSRFLQEVKVEPSKCILCGLCVRRCVEACWDSVIGFVGRGVNRRIVMYPEKASICSTCDHCHGICPTGRITSIGPDPPFPSIDDVLAGRE